MAADDDHAGPFAVKDCALVAIATGRKAQSLTELRHNLQTIHEGCIYYHFWGGLLRPRFDDPQYVNDFAVWCHYSLHDDTLAERLAVVDPTDFEDLEGLRQELIEIIDQRLDELERSTWVPREFQFHFIRSQIVVLDTGVTLEAPEELQEIVPTMPLGSIFYHFIDARRRSPEHTDDFRAWLRGCSENYKPVCDCLAGVDPYFKTLTELREQLADALRTAFQAVRS
ncbi:MAG: DUF5752 family protein [Thermodesulfobacteriota bacterium]